MSADTFPTDLLDQAKHLLAREPKRPRQASLRRAVSAAYYSVFHLLGAEAAKLLAPSVDADVSNRIRRWLDHGEMKLVCGGFSKPPQTNPYADLLRDPTNADLQAIASNFIKLQDARHAADYDLSLTYTRVQAALLIKTAQESFDAWRRIRKSGDANVFLLTLLMRKRWDQPRP